MPPDPWHFHFHGGLYDGLPCVFGADDPPGELIFRNVELHQPCSEFVYRLRVGFTLSTEVLNEGVLHYDLVPSSEMVRSYNVAQQYIRHLQDELDRLKRTHAG